jgi:predicted dehydrogenase/ABC-type lipoprotein export system ATPase subunit
MREQPIRVRGARENNLRDVDIDVPVGAITAFTGVSGSGKSSLVFDTIAAESQRQLNDTFPAFVRNRMPQLGKPDVDSMAGLSVAVIVDQKPLGGNARSTVGTATDLAPLLRLIYSRAGEPFVGYSHVFSFNQLAGMCPRCQGLGVVDDIDEDALIDPSKSLNEGALTFPTFAPGRAYWKRYAHSGLFDNDLPLGQWPREQVDDLLHADARLLEDPPPSWYASSKFEGLVPRFRRTYLSGSKASADKVRSRYADDFDRVVTTRSCPSCHGARLKQEVLVSRIAGLNIADASAIPIEDLAGFVKAIDDPRVAPVRDALAEGLHHLCDIGLGYLTFDRVSSTLSGGESQRVKLVRHIGSSLTRLTYILDEPSVGLHPADVQRLADLIVDIRDKGNTVLLVEHDPDLIAIADHVVELGPGAGTRGGRVVFEGTRAESGFAPDVALAESAVATAVASRDAARARSFADTHGIPRAYGRLEDLLHDPAVDAVYIATPHGTHQDLGLQALEAGKHVLIEKPMAIDSKQVRDLIAGAHRAGRFLMEAMWTKFNPAIHDLQRLISQGRIGDVRSVHASFGAPFPRDTGSRWSAELGGSALLDQGIYTVTLAKMLLGEPGRISASNTFFAEGVDQTEWVTFEYDDGRFAQLASSMVEWIDPIASINGTRGWIRLDVPFWATRSLFIQSGDVNAVDQPETREYEIEGNGFVPMIEAVSKSIQKGDLENALHPLAETLSTFALMDRIRESFSLASPTSTG